MVNRFFCYAVRGTALGANASEVLTLTINNQYDFIVDDIRVPNTNGLRVSIKNTNGDDYTNIPLNCALIAAASDNYWKIQGGGYRFKANTQLQITFDNQSGGGLTIPTEIQFNGRLIEVK